MNDTSKGWLQAVVNDMCSYTTSTGTKDVEETDADGNVTTVMKSVLYVNVTLKSYRDIGSHCMTDHSVSCHRGAGNRTKWHNNQNL